MQRVFAYNHSLGVRHHLIIEKPFVRQILGLEIDLFVRQSTQDRNELNQRLQQNSIKSIKELLNKIRAKNSLHNKFLGPVIVGNRVKQSQTESQSLPEHQRILLGITSS